MSDSTDHHTPTPEFSEFLARDIVRTFRHESRFAPASRRDRLGRPRTVGALAIGLIVGVATAFASTQVADARQRDEIASTTGAKRELAAVQLDLARANYEQVRRAFDKGAITQASRLSAEAEVHAGEARVARIELDLAESRKTAAPPRDELWAPLVGGRDFVNERLLIEAAAARQRVTSLEAAAADAERAFRAGVLTRPALADAKSDVLQAKREVDAVAQKLALRKQFLDDHLTPEDVARRLQRFELMTDVERAQQLLRLAEERLAIAHERSRLGQAGGLDAKQAEVAALEGSIEIDQLRVNSARSALTFREPVQQSIPTIDLPAASARATEPLGAVLGIREVQGGNVLVNDVGSRQLRLYDSMLASSIVTLDSTPGVVNRYGARVPLIRYLGDSSLLPDIASRTVRVLDANGQVARTVALPNAPINLSAQGFTDDKGRLLFPALADFNLAAQFDSTPIVRVDLESHRVDTVGRVKNTRWFGRMMWTDVRSPSSPSPEAALRTAAFSLRTPAAQAVVPAGGDWAVLANGSVAFVRGHDYHIDWIHPDGAMSSTPKLPFDWQRLAVGANQQQVDSAKLPRIGAVIAGGGRRGGGGGKDSLPGLARLYQLTVTRLADITATLSATGSGATIPDLDDNLWILPTGAAYSNNGQLVYDVVNSKGELFQRVRVPPGRSVVGFGKGGVVYLVAGDRTNGFYLERTKLVGGVK